MSLMLHHRVVEHAVTNPVCLAGECDHDECPEEEIEFCSECTMLAETVSLDALENPEVFARVSWPCATAEALEELREVWTGVGPAPEYLRAQLLRLERDWPELARAIHHIIPMR